MAAETGNNAAVPGAIIPVLTLAVPGSAPAAVLLAAMFIHGIRPGPLIMIEFPAFIFEVVAMVLLACVGILIFGILLTRPLLLRAGGAAREADAGDLRSVHDRLLRDRQPPVRHLRHARLRPARLRAARDEVPDGAARARPRARHISGQELPARHGALGWRPRAVLHAADRGGDRVRLHPLDRADDQLSIGLSCGQGRIVRRPIGKDPKEQT